MAGRKKGGGRRPTLKALVVDDHDAGRFLAQIILERFGLSVDSASDVAGCIARIGGGDYDLILVDKVLGDDDGLALAERLRAQSGAAVLVVSGLMPPETVPTGIDGWLSKPYTPRQMYAAVAAALAGYGKTLARERIV